MGMWCLREVEWMYNVAVSGNGEAGMWGMNLGKVAFM